MLKSLLVLASVGLSLPAADESSLSLRITNTPEIARNGEPVTCGMPLPRGFVARHEDLALFDEAGDAVPLQSMTTSVFRDGTPRWVLLKFAATLPLGTTNVYRLVKAPRPEPRVVLGYKLREGVAEIDTGAAQFRIGTERFRLFDSVRLEGQEVLARDRPGGIVLVDEAGATWNHVRTTSAEFEDAGPLSVVLAVRGEVQRAAKGPVAEFVCRLHFFAEKPEVRLFFTLRNPAAQIHPGNTWDLGGGGSLFLDDCSLVLPCGSSSSAVRIGVATGTAASRATKLYQDSSGGPHWDSANHVDKDLKVQNLFRGYRVYEGDRTLNEGERAQGWLHVRGNEGGIAVGVRDYWQNFPKALAFEHGAVRVGLWPREYAGMHEILGGEQKTHELLFVFHSKATTDAQIDDRMQCFHQPLYGLPSPETIYVSAAFWPTGPLDRQRFTMLERTCDTFVDPVGQAGTSVTERWDDIDEYGWRHFGDTFADNERTPPELRRDLPEHFVGAQPISHFGNEYDVNYGVLLQGLRRGDARWMWLADVMCRHYADICIYHSDAEPSAAYRHGPFTHTTHETPALRSTHRMYPSETKRYGLQYASGGPNAGHCYVASLAQHYYLTGDRNSREAFLEVADWSVHSPWFDERMMGDTRGIGNLLMTQVYAYQLTQDKVYYDAALKTTDFVRQPFAGLGGNLFAKAAGRFLDMKRENDELDDDYARMREKLLLIGDYYLTLPPENGQPSLEQTCFSAEVLFTCYLHAAPDHPRREQYFSHGKALMDRVHNDWPGTYRPTKTLIMCFANTGAMFKALNRAPSVD